MVSRRTSVVIAFLVCCLLLSSIFLFSDRLMLAQYLRSSLNASLCDGHINGHGCCSLPLAVVVNEGGSATSGKLFKGIKVNTYDHQLLHFSNHRQASKIVSTHSADLHALKCDHWSVVTTIFEPSEAVRRQVELKGWCIVVVGDRKGPKDYPIDATQHNYVFLTAADQEELANHFPVVKALPWNHFGRKNVGFLYAILHGAQLVWDFDDDNMLLSPQLNIPSNPWIAKANAASGASANNSSSGDSTLPGWDTTSFGPTFQVLQVQGYKFPSFNPYPLMGAPSTPCWPRGLPLEHIKYTGLNTSMLRKTEISTASIGIIQSLANHDPDIDAIFRLTMPIPFDFPGDFPQGSGAASRPLLVPADTYAPYNAQATLHTYSALWSLLLPVTVHGRVSDIWRGYIAQRLGRDIGMRLLFSAPMVRQDRNSHNYLADFDSEEPLYKRASKLLQQLDEWAPQTHSLVGRIEELWVYLYEHGYFALDDIVLVQTWLHSLLAAGYRFPELLSETKAATIAGP